MNNPTRFECSQPILRVEDMDRSIRFYVEQLGFQNAAWANTDFTSVSRDTAGIFLSRQTQGRGNAWLWLGVTDVEALHAEYLSRGVAILQPPTEFPWALEMRIEDPDGNVLRIGSEPRDRSIS
ncbi:MAG: glyoxalase superfamily protein [Candidatus Solibacter sp.]